MQYEFIDSIHVLTASQWNELCGDDYPFLRHEFLAALEDSGSTRADTGWQPQHLIARQDDELLAIVPLYVKQHSYGEYVFDWAWADAYRRYGREYYPKLVSAIPFTPAYGPRFLLHPSLDREQVLSQISDAIIEHARAIGASSWHCLFPDAATSQCLESARIRRRLGCQFHWFNRNYASFDEFLDSFKSRKRKNLKKERRKVRDQGITLCVKQGNEVSAEEWDLFYQLYHLTYFKRSGRQGYLGEDFFHRVANTMPEQIVMVIAYYRGEMVAAAINFRDQQTLYGRYWGCRQEFDFLHFEACYYQGIEYAIEHGLQRFDPGAQGEHKIQRGFTPIETWSTHWIAEPEFERAIGNFLAQEQPGIRAYMEEAREFLPFSHQQQSSCQKED